MPAYPAMHELDALQYQASQVVEPVEMGIDAAVVNNSYEAARKLLKAVRVDFIDLWSSSWINGVLRCGSARYRPDPACAAK